jgi:hypothetical protein
MVVDHFGRVVVAGVGCGSHVVRVIWSFWSPVGMPP